MNKVRRLFESLREEDEDKYKEDVPLEDVPVEDVPAEDIPMDDIPMDDMSEEPAVDPAEETAEEEEAFEPETVDDWADVFRDKGYDVVIDDEEQLLSISVPADTEESGPPDDDEFASLEDFLELDGIDWEYDEDTGAWVADVDFPEESFDVDSYEDPEDEFDYEVKDMSEDEMPNMMDAPGIDEPSPEFEEDEDEDDPDLKEALVDRMRRHSARRVDLSKMLKENAEPPSVSREECNHVFIALGDTTYKVTPRGHIQEGINPVIGRYLEMNSVSEAAALSYLQATTTMVPVAKQDDIRETVERRTRYAIREDENGVKTRHVIHENVDTKVRKVVKKRYRS